MCLVDWCSNQFKTYSSIFVICLEFFIQKSLGEIMGDSKSVVCMLRTIVLPKNIYCCCIASPRKFIKHNLFYHMCTSARWLSGLQVNPNRRCLKVADMASLSAVSCSDTLYHAFKHQWHVIQTRQCVSARLHVGKRQCTNSHFKHWYIVTATSKVSSPCTNPITWCWNWWWTTLFRSSTITKRMQQNKYLTKVVLECMHHTPG